MKWDRIEGNWKQFKDRAKEQWAKLTDDQLQVTAGLREKLVGRIQEAYGISKEESEKQVSIWLNAQQAPVSVRERSVAVTSETARLDPVARAGNP
jgi:uncharacterized protein YjbJ (UPF0337 family)